MFNTNTKYQYGSLAQSNVNHDEEDFHHAILKKVDENESAHDDHDHEEEEEDHDHGAFLSVRFMNDLVSERFIPLYHTVSEVSQTLIHPSFALSERALDPECDRRKDMASRGTSSITSEIANLSKNTIGGGVMSLSGGIALYANDPTAIISASAWIIALGFLFGYFCWLTGKSCEMSLSATYRECWERTVGRHGGILVAVATTLDPLMGLFANSAILSRALKFTLQGCFGIHWSIPECLLTIAAVALLPLCLLKNLDSLAPFSAFGMVAVLVVLACMIIHWLDGSYAPGGQFHDEIPQDNQPSFGTFSNPFSFHIMPFVCMAFTSFDMHYNSPRYYVELENATVPRFATVCTCSFGIISALYLSIAVVGYLTFGENSSSFILDNYSPNDNLATLARLSIGFSSLLTYPLNFMGLRDNLLDLLGLTDHFQTETKMRVFIVFLLAICIGMACFITDLGLISAVGGGTSVALVAFVLPALMFFQATKLHGKNILSEQIEVGFVMVFMVLMVIVGVAGVVASIAYGA